MKGPLFWWLMVWLRCSRPELPEGRRPEAAVESATVEADSGLARDSASTQPIPADTGAPPTSGGETSAGETGRRTDTAPDTGLASTPGETVNLPDMVVVPAGSYDQGCTPGQDGECYPNESPSAVIRLTRSFWMSETEVTQGQFESLMGYNPSCWRGNDRPVETVSWHEAAAYCNALSELEGLSGCYECTGAGVGVTCEVRGLVSIYECPGYRLPTEAEWEHAARCGADWKYAGSDELGSVGWYRSNSGFEAREVGGKLPNGCGLYDLSGNVWEWTNDRYDDDYYKERPSTDPEGPTCCSNRVVRGGAWGSVAASCRVAVRSTYSPAFRNYTHGFRLSRTIP